MKMKRNKICIVGIPEGEEKEKGTESIFKALMAENFLNLGREMDIQIYEAQRTPKISNLDRATPRQIIIKLSKSKTKKKNFKSSKRKEISYLKGNPHKPMGRFFNRNISGQERMGRHFKILKEKLSTKKSTPAKLSFTNEKEIETFINK